MATKVKLIDNTISPTLAGASFTGDVNFEGGQVQYDASTNSLDLQDSIYLQLGTDNDLRIYHDGSHARLRETTGDFRIQTTSSGVNALVAKQNAAVEIYHAGAKKLETSSTGATVTGTLTVTGDLDITGNVNSASVTDLDVEDKTITLGAGQTEGLSGGSGIIIDGSGASLLWDETNNEWDFNANVKTTGSLKGTTLRLDDGNSLVGGIFSEKVITGGGTSNDISIFAESISNGGEIHFMTNGSVTKRLTIDTSGNVGIGVTPASGIQLGIGNSANNSAVTRVTNGTVSVDLTASSGGKAFLEVGTSHPLVLATAATERMVIEAGGDVSVKAGKELRLYRSDNATYGSLEYMTGAGGLKLRDVNGDGMTFAGHSGNDYINILTNGNVGINHGLGGGNMNSKFNVFADGEAIRVDGTANTSRTIRFRNTGTNGSANAIITSDGSLQIKNDDANAAIYMNSVRDMEFQVTSGNGTAGHMRFYSYNTQIMHIDGANNRVGIGTDNPLALLHINGTGDAIRVTSTNTGVGGAQMDLLHYTSSPADGDIPGVINFGGYYSGTSSAYSAAIRSVWSNAGGREGQLQFITRQSGSQFDTQLTINHQGHMHLGHDKASVQFYVGNQGGIMGGNASHNVRGAGNLFMLNAGGTNGSYIFEANGTARLTIANDGVSLASAAPSADSYTHKFRSSNSADPGILLYREGQCALGITVRNASVDYASFLVGSSGASTSYDTEAGTTNVPLRIYQNGNVVLGRGEHTYNNNDGHIFYSNGRWASTFNYNSAGAEIYIQDNRTSSGTVAAFQYRINNSAQSGGTIYAGTNGYTGGNFSDYRLKNNVENLTGSLDKINALRVVSYNHVDSPDLTELGVIAHEIQEVFPEFVRGEKDAVWTQTDIDNYEGTLPDVEAGDIRAQQVDYFSKEWTSHFITAIQELKAELDAAKARITELEG